MRRRVRMGLAVVASATLAASCNDGPTQPGDGEVVPTESLTFVRFAPGIAPAVDTSFWAVRGETRELRLTLPPEVPGEDGEEFLRFKVDAESLLSDPDGVEYQPGDSVLIRVTLPEDSLFVFHFEPSGLSFSPAHPAELRVDYERANPDYNDDGAENEEDDEFEGDLYLWKQEVPGAPWVRLSTVKVEGLREMEADITSFTGFALAGH